MKHLKWILFGLVLFLAGCGNNIETNMSEQVADFSFTNQNQETVELEDLKGEWWVADFIFTNCTTVCLPMTSNMAQLQTAMKEEDVDAQLVSFSIDPKRDTPQVLKRYGESYDADFRNWSFLTGYDFETIKEFSIKSFRNLIVEAQPGSDQLTHGTSFFLVNPEGEIIKKYDGVSSDSMDQILEDLKTVTS